MKNLIIKFNMRKPLTSLHISNEVCFKINILWQLGFTFIFMCIKLIILTVFTSKIEYIRNSF